MSGKRMQARRGGMPGRALLLGGALIMFVGVSAVLAAESPVSPLPVKIEAVRGEMLIQERPGAGWRPAHAREQLRPGMSVRTLEKAGATLNFSERNLVYLGAHTTLVIEEASLRKDQGAGGSLFAGRRRLVRIELTLREGVVRSVLRGLRAGAEFSIRSVLATAAARGTDFTSELTPSDAQKVEDLQNFVIHLDQAVTDGLLRPSVAQGIMVKEIARVRDSIKGGGRWPENPAMDKAVIDITTAAIRESGRAEPPPDESVVDDLAPLHPAAFLGPGTLAVTVQEGTVQVFAGIMHGLVNVAAGETLRVTDDPNRPGKDPEPEPAAGGVGLQVNPNDLSGSQAPPVVDPSPGSCQ